MKSKSWIKYLVYTLLFFGLIYLDRYIARLQSIYQSETFSPGVIYFVMSMIVKIFIGLSLGLEYIGDEMKKVGKWKINLPKIILMVIPSLYFSIPLFFYLIPNESLINILMKPAFIFAGGDLAFAPVFQILFGYFLITSFYKEKKLFY